MKMGVTANEALAAMQPKHDEYMRRLADLREAARLAAIERRAK
jgi:hypothetical protein